jgi:hypothetical protein
MADLSPDLAGKLSRLIPRLASDHDGEIIATVAAIRRTLDRAGLSLHDLAARLAEATPIRQEAKPQPKQADPHLAEHLARARWLLDHAGDDLTERQRAFVANAIRLLDAGHTLTDKQAGWLTGLCAMHGYDT